MKWCSAISDNPSLERGIEEVTSQIKNDMGSSPTDVALFFVSSQFSNRYQEASTHLREKITTPILIGSSGGGVVGDGKEVEHRPAVSLVAASLPHVTLHPFHLEAEEIPDLDDSPESWEDLVGIRRTERAKLAEPARQAVRAQRAQPAEHPHFLLVADPFSFPCEEFLMGLDYSFPQSIKIGGLASGATSPGGNALYLNEKVYHSGLVGLAFSGEIDLEAVVAQGCRPIGEPLVITNCTDNILLEVNHQPPLTVLQDLALRLSGRDLNLMRHSLFLGLLMDPFRSEPARGDFLVRNILGVDYEKGILVIGSPLRKGQVVQFHLRDARTSHEDLHLLLSRYMVKNMERRPLAALLFSCLGRGEYLYGVPHHDSLQFYEKAGKIPLGGFFCNGEIGPVGNTTYLHGYTSCFAIFSEPAR